jgi:putative PIN family toxin of toxin-antitoxin system
VRAVIDTNVLLSGLLWRGAPHALIEHVQAGTLAMVSSPVLLAELAEVIGRAKFDEILERSNTSRERSLAEMRQLAEVIVPPPLPQPVCRDPDDDHLLACALAAQADLIVSGDADLLDLREYRSIRIVAAAEALHLIERAFLAGR